MMQDREDRGLDLWMRSALADAGERPPRRVWRGVRNELRGARAPWWRPLAAIAVAGALAAAVILPLSHRGGAEADLLADAAPSAGAPVAVSEADVPAVGEVPEVDVPAVGEVSESAVRAVTPASITKAPSAVAAPVSGTAGQAAAVSDNSDHTYIDPENEAGKPLAGTSEAVPDDAEASVSADSAPRRSPDPFAVLAAEDARTAARRKAVVTAGGLVGTNDRAGSGRLGGVVFSAPSRGGKTDRISESGESSFAIPLSAGLGFRLYLTDRLALGTGVRYTRLSRVFEGVYTDVNTSGIVMNTVKDDIRHTQDYVGVPLQLSYDLISGDAFSTYVYAGGAADRALSNKFHVPGVSTIKGDITGLQWSVGAGFGIGFRINDFMGVYLDPGVVYYFDCDQPKSIWTQQRLQMRFEAGLRFDLR